MSRASTSPERGATGALPHQDDIAGRASGAFGAGILVHRALEQHAGTQFDESVVEALCTLRDRSSERAGDALAGVWGGRLELSLRTREARSCAGAPADSAPSLRGTPRR